MTGAENGKRPDKSVDFANYFCTYAFLYHQKEMLSDQVRMEAYYNAVFKNRKHFENKVVLDVGTGSGILAIWAAQAGARKVYAVEATDMAKHARTLVEANHVEQVVEVIQESIEDVTLPEKVDIIISEWMGYFLLRESMFDSVIVARDRWLKPGGALYPSHARMFLAPVRTNLSEQKSQEYQHSLRDWSSFTEETSCCFGVDMGVLTESYREEQKRYFLQTSQWANLYPNQVVGRPAVVKELDCLTATISEIESLKAAFECPLFENEDRVTGFAGWFDVQFAGAPEQPAEQVVELNTAPSADNTTHWGQQVFLLNPHLNVPPGQSIKGTIEMTRSQQNHRLMDVVITHSVGRLTPVRSSFHIE